MSRVNKRLKKLIKIIHEVNKFACLGSVMTSTCGAEEGVNTHIQKASAVSTQFYQAWKAREISNAT
jgi:hypothetical protein